VPTYRYPRPAVTVDVVLFAVADGALRVLLIQRAAPPFAGRWALPGGFVDEREDLAAAAKRELREETGLRVARLVQLGAYGKPGRDPRGHTVSVVFLAVAADGATGAAGVAGDDARALRWFAAARPPALAFDHRVVLRDARARFAELARDGVAFARVFVGPRRRAATAALRRAARGSAR
jgi:8-oxo-dGTP diphosphatase